MLFVLKMTYLIMRASANIRQEAWRVLARLADIPRAVLRELARLANIRQTKLRGLARLAHIHQRSFLVKLKPKNLTLSLPAIIV
jgi:hypothetical protein